MHDTIWDLMRGSNKMQLAKKLLMDWLGNQAVSLCKC